MPIFCANLGLIAKVIPILASLVALLPPALAQDVTSFEEQRKLILAPRAIASIGTDLFGDTTNFYNGALAFRQTDVSLPGNNALPVMAGRRIVTGERVQSGKAFGRWELDIPHIHGLFSKSFGWKAADGSTARCSKFGAPPMAMGTNGGSYWNSDEFWKGNYIYVPGHGDQRLLKRHSSNSRVPSPAGDYPLVTSNLWAISCLSVLKNAGTGSDPVTEGEGFLAISPDGTRYYFDWLARYPAATLRRGSETPESAVVSASKLSLEEGSVRPEPDGITSSDETTVIVEAPENSTSLMAATSATLARDEIWLLPSKVVDRHGNTVIYTYDPAKPRNLTRIDASDGRALVFSYVPDGNNDVIETVTDGSRTWTYGYRTDGISTALNLDRVTLPDNSAWNFANFYNLLQQVNYINNGGCYDAPRISTNELVGSIVHPSGATGTFTLRPTVHGRSYIALGCTDASVPPPDARFFATESLVSKSISGPGLDALSWTIDYGLPNASWADCTNCPDTKTVSVTDPAGHTTRHIFGNRKDVNEGRLQSQEIGWDGSAALQTIANTYSPFGAGPYPDYAGFGNPGDGGDLGMDIRPAPLKQRIITRQGTTFTWEANEFDTYAKPTKVTRSSSLGHTRTEITEYDNNETKWVLGRVSKLTDGTGKVMLLNEYNSSTANLEKVSKFGKLQQTLAYNTDGTVKSIADGKNQSTQFSDYKRGIAQRIDYADGTFEKAVVNDIGKITSLTNEVGSTTTFGYKAGKLASIVHPGGDTVAWNGVTLSLSQIAQQEYDLGPGHWKQTVTTGGAEDVTYFDALWRPVYSERWDSANRNNTVRFTRHSYDFNGRVTFESYPQRSQGSLTTGKSFIYDALGRLTRTEAASELGNLTSSHTYSSGYTSTITDALGRVSTYTYQAFDEPVDSAIATITMPTGVTVAIARDDFGKPRSIQRSGASGKVTRSYVYDDSERLCKTVEPETGATLQDYDAANNVVWRAGGTDLSKALACDRSTVAASRKASHLYDKRNRLTDTTFGDGSPAIARTYTLDGLPETVNSKNAKWTYTYNKRRLLERESLLYATTPYQIDRSYDANGSLASLKYPGATQAVSYSPNALGEPQIVGSYATNISYHPNGAIAGFTYGNGITRAMAQNMRGLPEVASDAGILHETYTYDANGNVLGIRDAYGDSATRTMTYDALDRLETVTAPNLWGKATYGYDAQDNLVSSSITAGANARSATHAIDAATNRLGSVTSGHPSFNFSYGYDAQGNITQRGNRSYVFDMANRMSAATGLATYEYDGHGRRVSVVGNDGVNRIHVYSQDGRLLHTTAGANSPTNYIYLHNHVIAEVK